MIINKNKFIILIFKKIFKFIHLLLPIWDKSILFILLLLLIILNNKSIIFLVF